MSLQTVVPKFGRGESIRHVEMKFANNLSKLRAAASGRFVLKYARIARASCVDQNPPLTQVPYVNIPLHACPFTLQSMSSYPRPAQTRNQYTKQEIIIYKNNNNSKVAS